MRITGIIQVIAVGLAVVGFCLPQSILAASPGSRPDRVVNVTLTKSGALLGQVVDTAGIPKSKIPVTIHSGKQQLSVGLTDERGYFAFQGVRGGTYRLAAAQGQGAYRVWAYGTAPPKTQQGALIISDNTLVRALDDDRRLFGGGHAGHGGGHHHILSNPWVIAGVVTAAVGIPVIIHSSKDDDTVEEPASQNDTPEPSSGDDTSGVTTLSSDTSDFLDAASNNDTPQSP